MADRVQAPPIDHRRARMVSAQLKRMIPFYTPEWPASANEDAGLALVEVFSLIAEGVIRQLNQSPRKNFIEFLNLLGIQLLPARPAQVPVQFRLAAGLERGVRIPAGTRCTAPPVEGREEELPFETLEDLLATPSPLQSLVAVDPFSDAIFRPPSGFLGLDLAARPLPSFQTSSFSSAGSRLLQLDRVDGLNKGDFLKISGPAGAPAAAVADCCGMAQDAETGESAAIERLIVDSIDKDGRIVRVGEDLERDYPAGTAVEKVADFALFESKNLQAHILYLGHGDLFNVKSAAEFEIDVKHLANSQSNLEGLAAVWEYWSEESSDEGSEERWLPFQVEADGSDDFRRNGVIVLTKPEGEIKEREVNGTTNRWIRARLTEPIPNVPPRKLPTLDQVRLLVKSSADPFQANIAPELIFHNDTQLELPEFLPFGTEPRLFERFYMGSQEVLSKKEAEIHLDFQIKTKGIIATPSAANFQGNVRVFAHGTAGRLFDVTIRANPDRALGSEFEPHPEFASVIAAESSPAASAIGDHLFVLVRGEDGLLYERFYDGVQWTWILLGVPNQGLGFEVDRIVFDPAVALEDDGIGGKRPRVFVVGESAGGAAPARDLYSASINRANGQLVSPWTRHNLTQIDSSPTTAGLGTDWRVFACVKDGQVQQLTATNPNWSLVAEAGHPFEVGEDPRGKDEDDLISEASPSRLRPFAQVYDEGGGSIVARVAVVDSGGRLLEITFDSVANQWKVVDHDQPASSVTAVSAPTGFILDPGTDHETRWFFVRGSDNHLWERRIRTLAGGIEENWFDRDRAGDSDLRRSPVALFHRYADNPPVARSFLSVFSGSGKNSLLEFRQRAEEEGLAQGGPDRTLVLEPTASSVENQHQNQQVYIDSGPGADDTLRLVDSYGAAGKVLLLNGASPWGTLPNGFSHYRIVGAAPLHQGNAPSATLASIDLDDASGLTTQMVIVADGQIRKIDAVSVNTVNVVPGWDKIPPNNTPWAAFEIVAEGTVDEATARTIALDKEAPQRNGFFDGAQILIETGTGANQTARRITAYSGTVRVALVDAAWATNPDSTSGYRIVGELEADWRQYQNPQDVDLRPKLSWEYWNGSGWVRLKNVRDRTLSFLIGGSVIFRLPEDIDQTEVAGQENYWVRARITDGDYGRETFTTVDLNGVQQLVSHKEGIRPPSVLGLKIGYRTLEGESPQRCLTFNNLNYIDQTAACRTPEKEFSPFLSLDDLNLALYLGFGKPLQSGPLRLLLAAEERAVHGNPPRFNWTFRSKNRWTPIQADDTTEALVKEGLLTLNVPPGFQALTLFGQSGYWIKGTLAKGSYAAGQLPILRGAFLNSVRCSQAQTVVDEILGSSDGEENHEFEFFSSESLIGEPEVRVRELLSLEELEELKRESGDDAVVERDELGNLETWVRWQRVEHFFGSNPNSRHFVLDRARRRIRFGNGKRGQIPSGGIDNIRAFRYQAGGGSKGNVAAGEINALTTAVAGVDSVLNPVEAGGGSDTVDVEEMLRLGPARLSTRDRAVTAEDFEWLAVEASRQVAKARCLPNSGPEGQKRAGWVSVYIVPDSKDKQPQPSLELLKTVRRYLEDRCEASLKAAGRILVEPPLYVPVSVQAEVFAKTLDDVARVELAVHSRLLEYLHPLTGGVDGRGWEFGRDVAASDIYVLLESIKGVDHVENLTLRFNGLASSELATVGPNALVAPGDNQITIVVAEGG